MSPSGKVAVKDTSFKSNYTIITDAFYDFAYYFCCLPYKIKKGRNGKYTLEEWLPQKIVSYTILFTFLYWIANALWMKYKLLMKGTSSVNGNTPTLCLYLLLLVSYLALCVILAHTQMYIGSHIVDFQNKLQRYSNFVNKHLEAKEIGFFRKKLYNGTTIRVFLLLIKIFTAINLCIPRYSTFVFTESVHSAQLMLVWSERNTSVFSNTTMSDRVAGNYALIITSYIIYGIKTLKDVYSALLLTVGVVTLCIVGSDYWWIVETELRLSPLPLLHLKDIGLKSLTCHRKINAMAESFNKGHGLYLLTYILCTVPYYSLNLIAILDPKENINTKLFKLQFLLNCMTVLYLGATFNNQMESIQKLRNLTSVTRALPHNTCLLIHHVSSLNTSVRATLFPLTYSTCSQVVAQIMVLFLLYTGSIN